MSVEDRASELNEILVPLKGILPDTEYPYVFSAAESSDAIPAYTTAIDVAIASRISAVKELVPQYQADVDTVIARGAALEHYRALLNAAKAGIRVLRKALDTPQSLDASVEEMLSLSFKVKRDIETIRAASMTAR
jgi:hypothetical protein